MSEDNGEVIVNQDDCFVARLPKTPDGRPYKIGGSGSCLSFIHPDIHVHFSSGGARKSNVIERQIKK